MVSEVIGLEKVDKQWLDERPELKVLGVYCTGLDLLDRDECSRRNIKIISLRDYPDFLKTISSTAEHTLGLIIALMRNYKTALNGPYKDREEYRGNTLSGKTLGIIGYGRIGCQVKKIADALAMNIIPVDDSNLDILGYLLKESDIVTIHIPLDGNVGLFTKRMFLNMKQTAYLINTSRDAVVEKGALLWALENGIIKGAAVDFCDDKDLVEYARTHSNLVLTNHLGGCTFEDMERTKDFIKNKVEEYIKTL